MPGHVAACHEPAQSSAPNQRPELLSYPENSGESSLIQPDPGKCLISVPSVVLFLKIAHFAQSFLCKRKRRPLCFRFPAFSLSAFERQSFGCGSAALCLCGPNPVPTLRTSLCSLRSLRLNKFFPLRQSPRSGAANCRSRKSRRIQPKSLSDLENTTL
jgi:hypothetical protein